MLAKTNSTNKKILINSMIIVGLLFITKSIFAEGTDEAIRAYLADDMFDLLGHDYEKILFNGINNIPNSNYMEKFIKKVKFIPTDIKTFPLQAKATFKVFEDNVGIYAAMGGVYGAKASMGAKAFGELATKMLKFVVKL